MDWAEDEIRLATRRHRGYANELFHSFALLTPTADRMSTEFVYRSHCRELLQRVVTDADTRRGTAAELVCTLSQASMVAPFTAPAAGLYFRLWGIAFPDQPNFGAERLEHQEALHSSAIDDLEATLRRKLSVPDRRLRGVQCQGRHHGTTVRCRYHTTPAQQAA
ncbi:hypothetical protein [Actinophytocola sp.]|uniref:hypothetical protein n=1 Tax=Actinophytocola sp. TaxID=1872138 RepID=UPI002D8095F4|nr:hypothetical protein [Actinophytocola sp.]HET9144029.1 hypothetical protein [Actinophytocola sp.]